MDQIIIGVDTHRSSHIAVWRLGQQDLALSKPLVSKALALTALVYPEICKQRDTLSWTSFVPIVNTDYKRTGGAARQP